MPFDCNTITEYNRSFNMHRKKIKLRQLVKMTTWTTSRRTQGQYPNAHKKGVTSAARIQPTLLEPIYFQISIYEHRGMNWP